MKSKIIFLFLFLILGCSQEKNTVSPLLNYIPKNATIVIRINDDATFKSELKNNDFLSKIEKGGVYKKISKKIKALQYIQPKSESLLGFVELGKESFELVYITKIDAELFQLDAVTEKSVETFTYENRSIDRYELEGTLLYTTVVDQKIIISSSQLLLENIIRNKDFLSADPQLNKLFQIANTGKSANVIVNAKNSNSLLSSVLKTETTKEISGLTDYISLDLDMGQNYLNLSGISMSSDSIKNYVNLFKGTSPVNNRTPLFAPISANAILSYTYQETDIFVKNQQRYLDRAVVMDTLFTSVDEIGEIYMGSQKAIVLNAYSSEQIADFLDGLEKNAVDYQGNLIVELAQTDFLNSYFNPLVQKFEANYYTIIENAFIFSKEKETLQTIITNFKSGATFEKSAVYTTAMALLADESTMLFIANASGIEQNLTNEASEELLNNIKNADLSKYAFAMQLVADAGFYHSNILIHKFEKEIKSNTTSTLYSIQLDAEIATSPQFVVNHRTGKKEIVVQDKENNLYLISTEGKVLWKKPLDAKIQGAIEQIDIYKNGRLQLAFTTENEFLIVDRNGEDVKPFPKTYEGGNLSPLAVFDYDNKKDYRFVVAQGTKILMYDSKGEIVKGFKATEFENPIMGIPEHFRINNKDFLVFKEATGNLKILNRLGESRITVSEKIEFSDNRVFLYKDKITLTDAKGTLFQIDNTGKLTKTNLDLSKDHRLDATSKTLVVMNDNTLRIKDKKVTLELGVYTKPKIFLINDKIYVTVTDTQNQLVYLFDSNGISIPNFPIFGASDIDFIDMDNDGKLEIVVKDLENSLLVYKMY